jgi:hypothetical protein
MKQLTLSEVKQWEHHTQETIERELTRRGFDLVSWWEVTDRDPFTEYFGATENEAPRIYNDIVSEVFNTLGFKS